MPEPIAIVGTACRFPGSASSPSKLWELLREPRDVLREFPTDRLNFDNFYDINGETHGRSDVPGKSYLLDEDIRVFDAAFFRINAKEAAGMDPQHRILLETAYEAFECAGWTLDDIKGSQTSVHVGVMTDDYYTMQASDPDTLGSHAATGLSRSILSNRVSYSFDLKGPSMTIDTACSSSLVALHLAVQGLRNGESSQALVGGTNLLLHPHWYVAESSLHMLSADSRCRMWDESANGYARGEGCGVVVLKTLSKAIKDGDHIECIVRETGVNSDGSTDGLTMPSSKAQARLIRQTYESAGLDPVKDRCQYFECHGTGTQAGDPVEARAIHDAFETSGESSGTTHPLYCGSVKTVIGHLEGSAGLAGVIKASLAVQNGIIPPNMHFQNLNPSIKPLYSGLCVPTSAQPWPDTAGSPRRASVNSFGFGGTNAHAILDSYHAKDEDYGTGHDFELSGSNQSWTGLVGPFVLSARSQTALVNVVRDTKQHIEVHPFLNLDTFSHILHSKRTAFPYRIAVPAVSTREELLEILGRSGDSSNKDAATSVRAMDTPSGILGIFTGQGAQTVQMGKQLLLHCPGFSKSIEQCEKVLQDLHQGPHWSLKEELLADEARSRLSDAEVSQPLCCAIQIALVDLLRTSYTQFDAVVGHSSGEIAAAYAAGLLKLEDAMAIAYYRGLTSHLAQGSDGQRGGMIASIMSPQDARELCDAPMFLGRLWLAAINSPSSVTISGDVDAIDEVKAHLSSRDVRAKILNVDKAYHSEHMQKCAAKYLELLRRQKIRVQRPTQGHQCSWFSSVQVSTNIAEDPSAHELDGQYWINNLVQPVLFSEAVASSVTGTQVPITIALEVGPHSALKGPTGQILQSVSHDQMPYMGCLDKGRCSVKAFSAALGLVWTHLGPGRVNFAGWRQAFGLNPRPLPFKDTPSYPWDHDQILWRESRLTRNYRLKGEPVRSSLLGRLHEDYPAEKIWRNLFMLSEMPWMRGHIFQGQVLFPAAGYISLAIDAAIACVDHRPVKFLEAKNVNIVRALVINENDEVEVIFKMHMVEPLKGVGSAGIVEADFEAYTSHDNKTLERSCYGQVSIHLGHLEPNDLPLVDTSDAELTLLSTERFNSALLEVGLRYDGTFRAIDNLSRTWGQAKASASWNSEDLRIGSMLHPAILDTAFQVGLGTFLSQAERSMGSPYLPVTIRRVIVNPSRFSKKASSSVHLDMEASLNTLSARTADVDVSMWAPSVDKTIGIQVEGLLLRAITEPDSLEDRNLFIKTLWREESAFGLKAPDEFPFDVEEVVRRTLAYERVALFYMRMLVEAVSQETLDAAPSHHHEHLRFARTVLQTVSAGSSPTWLPEWLRDDPETIRSLIDAHNDDVDMAMLVAVGENLPAVVRGESQMIEHMIKDSLLIRLYTESRSLSVCNRYVAEMALHVSHKHPQIKVLEIGAGTGGTTMSVLGALGDAITTTLGINEDIGLVSGPDGSLVVSQIAERSASAREWKISVRWSIPLFDNDQQPLYLCYGHTLSRKPVLALVEELTSSIVVAKDLVQDTEKHDLSTPQDLAKIATHLVASLAISRTLTAGTTLIPGPENMLTQTLKRTAAQCGRKAVFLDIASHPSARDCNWAYIHPLAAERIVRRTLPTDTSSVLNLTSSTAEVVQKCLPRACSFYELNVSSLLRDIGSAPKTIMSEAHIYWSRHSSMARSTEMPLEVIRVENITSTPLKAEQRLGAVLGWTRTAEIDALAQTIRPEALFSSDKTYLLVGMASELGQSLCHFMTRAGARYIVLASRSVREDPSWVKELRTTGVHIRVVKMDVTDRKQVSSVVAQLRSSMPAIIGVANAALVFEAGVFINFSAENITRQLRPKVDGTLNLDREFATDDLDFFLTFGSLATVCGNPGQAMYHAGNLFMASLIEQRRRRGQAGSILNFGLLVDVGYVARMDRADGSDIEGTLRNLLLTPLSEAEFHHVFLQGIVSGRPDSPNGEVIMGMEPYIDNGQSARPAWVDKPLFSHMIKRSNTEGAAVQSSSPSSSSMEELTQRVLVSSTLSEAIDAVRELFFAKLELMVQVARVSIHPAAPLSDLGLDSLNGTELRQWLIKTLKVELPLLKILGQEPLESICAFVAERSLSCCGKDPGTMNIKPALREDTLSSTQNNVSNTAKGTESSFDVSRLSHLDVDPAESPTSSSWVSLRRPSAITLESEEIYTPMESSTNSLQVVEHLGGENADAATDTVNATRPSVPRKPIHLQDRLASPPLIISRTAPLSFAQSGIHFLESLRHDPTTFNVTVQYDVRGLLDRSRLARAVEKTLARHEAYRTCFFASIDSEQVEQHLVMDSEFCRLEQVDSTVDKAREYCEIAFENVATHKYQLAVGETFRAILLNHRPDWHSIVFGFHLMASDALSFSLFLKDLDQAYQMNAAPGDLASYLDHSQNQRALFQSGGLNDEIAYWKTVLLPAAAPLPLLPLAHVKARQAQQTYKNNIVQDRLSPEKVQRVKAVARQHGVTLMQFYLAVMQVLLARLADVDYICIGVTDSGRGDGDFAHTVGHFANILPMRFKVDTSQSFASLLTDTSHTVLSAFDNSRVPFDVILEKLGIPRSSEHTPLFQVAFNYRIGEILELPLGETRMTMEKYSDVITTYDLTINVTQTAGGGHSVECITSDDLYTHAATDLFVKTYNSLITSLISGQSTTIDKCNLFSDAQVEHAIVLGRGPSHDFGWPKTLSERLLKITSKFGDFVALQDNQATLTYRELSQEMARTIRALRSHDMIPGSRIVCLCEPGVTLYTLMLAILHIGCVYVPLDAALPTSRHSAIIDACGPQLIVFHPATAAMAERCCESREIDKLNVSLITQTTNAGVVGAPHNDDERDSFLLFTSGSTGTPKGIRLGQAGMMNYAASKRAHLGLGQVRVLQQTSSGFDMAIAQAFNAFANGGTLVIAPLAARGDPAMISDIIRRHSIELTIATPSEYQLLGAYATDVLRDCHSWAHACSGGETVSPCLLDVLQRLELSNLVFTNCYGPTEISCATTFQNTLLRSTTDFKAAPSVGKAIPNTALRIVADDGATVLPVGIPGEICVTGRGVARGYLDTSMNHQKFVEFNSRQENLSGLGLMYRTGDRGYLQPDGTLVFIGRTDGGETMIKLRGLRVDLDEVANAILQAVPARTLDNVVVTVRGDPQYLVAHVVCSAGTQLSQRRLQAVLQSLELPRYMIPALIVPLDRLPTTLNGKLDRKAIQKLDIGAGPVDAETTDPLTVPEAELRDLWVQVLEDAAALSVISPTTDFFTTGGSSLLLVRLQNSIKERFGVSLPLQALYQATTLRKMAAAMHEQRVDCSGDISWEKEASIPGDMLANPGGMKYSRQPRLRPQEVLLTGATSFLGRGLLEHLVKQSNTSKIHCIAVTEQERRSLSNVDKQKVVVYPGSLMSPTLGLSPAKVDLLKTNVDLIIHAAVQGHCMNNYDSVKSALLYSTHFLASIAIPRKIPFHYISAPRIVLLSGKLEGGPVSMASHPPPTDGSQGVTSAKWVSEQFLESLSAKALLPVVIHRHCALVGEGAPADDVPNSVVRFSLLSRKVPRFDGALGYFDIERVEIIAESILRSVSDQNGSISYYHHSSNVRAPLSNFTQRLREAFGGDFEEVEPLDWLQAAASHSMPELLLIHLKANMESPKPLVFPYLGR